ncbi:hypothetical protein MD484_g3688, partial [Candolleomyces efflorescens]
MLVLFNHQLTRAPPFRGEGVPFYAMLRESMNTPTGWSTLLSTELNAQLRKIFDTWSTFLSSPESRHVLVPDEDGGWFSPSALTALTRPFFSDDCGEMKLEDIFECDADKLHYGFESWDAFFTRQLRPGVHPLEDPHLSNVISCPCDSTFYNLQEGVKEVDQFWIKGEVYSLQHLFNNDPITKDFIGGTIYQGFLAATSYHRWHSPVDGVVQKITLIPGTPFVQSPTTFVEKLDLADNPYLRSQAFITSLTTRMLIFIESSNPAVGMMCFVAVGMLEVSTCEATVSVGERVSRGQEIGMFHFGGSSFCMVFRPGANIQWDEDAVAVDMPVKVRGRLGTTVDS